MKIFILIIFGVFLFVDSSIILGKKINEVHSTFMSHRFRRQAPLAKETTFFDKNTENIIASPRSLTKYPIRNIQDGAPETPQKIRLRSDGRANPSEGRIEVYDTDLKKWGLICDDYWTLSDANVTCRQLGFQLAAREALRHDHNGRGNWTENDYLMSMIKCQGNEHNLFQCFHTKKKQCSGKSSGVSCIYNTGCAYGWTSYNGACYKVNEQPLSFEDAQTACNNQNSKLAYILDTGENNFLSNMLYTTFQKITKAWIGGYYAKLQMDTGEIVYRWNWHSTIHSVKQWNKSHLWFQGFDQDQSNKSPKDDFEKNSCISLNRLYKDSKRSNNIYDVNYFWWDNLSCKTKLPFICQKNIPQGRSNCYEGIGTGYRGTTSRTTQGTVCVKWSNPNNIINPSTHPDAGLGNHNYCRNPDNDMMPWCYVNVDLGIYGYCSMVKCSDVITNEVTEKSIDHGKPGIGEGDCSSNQFFCPSMILYNRKCIHRNKVCDKVQDCIGNEDENPEFCKNYFCTEKEFFCQADMYCIMKSHICDGKKNCADGADERNCTSSSTSEIAEKFEKYNSKILIAKESYDYFDIPIEKCAEKCKIIYSQFPCRSFNYLPPNETRVHSECHLLKILKSEYPEKLIDIPYEGDHYSLKLDCKDKFKCKSGMCISLGEKCDGKNDCGDNSDEVNCQTVTFPPFEIRLTGSNNDWEGKVEIRHEGEWGFVCDDRFTLSSAHVVCKQLGFPKALEAVHAAGSRFGKVRNPNIWLDEVKCNGTELSIEDCPHEPWGQHNCQSEEISGVVCKADRACEISEYRCEKEKLCIKMKSVCDGVKDCSDGSDEPEGKCNMKIMLVNGPDLNSGRVEIIGPYSRGTVCGDKFDDNDATVICRMLGIPGRAEAIKSNIFGEGVGEIAFSNLQCKGDEQTILNCSSKWGEHRCSHKDDVGVICGLNEKREVTTTTKSAEITHIPGVSCGKRPIIQKRSRIVGGFETIYGGFPWQVGIRRKRDDYDVPWCGGSILSEDWIISAAHCYDIPKNEFLVRTGDWNNNQFDTYEQVFEIEELHINPKYYGPPIYDFDLALIKIKRNDGGGIIFNNYVQPVCLPKPGIVPDAGTKCFVSGWGDTLVDNPEILLAAEVPLIKAERCNEFYKGRISPRMQCAGYEAGGIDTCQGDSGGPLVCRVNGIYTIFGATSWGDGCAVPRSPGVYAKIETMLDWVSEITNF